MKKIIYTLFLIISATFLIIIYSGCNKDNAENLYPNAGNCDTIIAKFSTQVSPILMANCATNGCHTTTIRAGGLAYQTYSETLESVNDKRMINSINHNIGASKMPKNASKLIPCDINKIQAWINRGALNN